MSVALVTRMPKLWIPSDGGGAVNDKPTEVLTVKDKFPKTAKAYLSRG